MHVLFKGRVNFGVHTKKHDLQHIISAKLTIHWDIKPSIFPMTNDLCCSLFLCLYCTSLSCLKQFIFKTCITLSSFTAWFACLFWHFISNCPLSWVLCSSVLPPSRGLRIQFKTMFGSVSPCTFLCSTLTWSVLLALLSLFVSLLHAPHQNLRLPGRPDADSNWLKAIGLQIWQDCTTVQSLAKQPVSSHSVVLTTNCTFSNTCLAWWFSKWGNSIWGMCSTRALCFHSSLIRFCVLKPSLKTAVPQQWGVIYSSVFCNMSQMVWKWSQLLPLVHQGWFGADWRTGGQALFATCS